MAIEKSAPVSAFRVSSGKVRVVLEHLRGSPHDDITPERARILAAELLVAASEDASRAVSQVGDAVETVQLGHQLFQHVSKVARRNGWVK